MCGIVALWARRDAGATPFTARLLRRATQQLTHRGPDGEGYVGWGLDGTRYTAADLTDQPLSLGLGHRRLKILDLTDAGRQPMQGPPPSGCWLTFNGEIYNYRELRDELIKFGYRFQTGTDTEVILAAYDAWGPECVRHFNGMWAFVLFDPMRRRLVASRDRFGVKPLYYLTTAQGTMFASEIGALLRCAAIRPAIVMRRLGRYLVDRLSDDSTETIYRDIHELQAGHTLELDTVTGTTRSVRYWDLPDEPDLELTDAAALDRFSELIEDAVRLRLHADVPVAITLSGGVDSSVLAVAARRVAGAGRVQTFTSRFPGDPSLDESRYAAHVAERTGAEARYVQPSTDSLIADEVALTAHQALPYRSLSLYVHWAILAAIRAQDVPVVLSGQGGDETFLGYERYHTSALLHALPDPVRAAAGLWRGANRSDRGMFGLAAMALYFTAPRLQRVVRRGRVVRVIRPDWLEALTPPAPEIFGDIRRQQRSELLSRCLPALLRYDDRTAGALGMETRLPFLDYRVAEFAYRLPLRHKIRDGWTKYLLRSYLARHGCDAVAWRRGKYAFYAPQTFWTHQLIAARGSNVAATPFARALLNDGVSLARLPAAVAWDIYNCLHLASLIGWEADECWTQARAGAA